MITNDILMINKDEFPRRKLKLYILDKTIIIETFYQNWKNTSKINNR